MAFCFSGSLLRANFNIVFSCFILLLFVTNKFLFFSFFLSFVDTRTLKQKTLAYVYVCFKK